MDSSFGSPTSGRERDFADRVTRQSLTQVMSDKTRVLIVGGGFSGLYAALEFEKRDDPRFEVVFFSRDFVQYLDQRALAASRTETGAAPWNRNQRSDPSKSNNRVAA